MLHVKFCCCVSLWAGGIMTHQLLSSKINGRSLFTLWAGKNFHASYLLSFTQQIILQVILHWLLVVTRLVRVIQWSGSMEEYRICLNACKGRFNISEICLFAFLQRYEGYFHILYTHWIQSYCQQPGWVHYDWSSPINRLNISELIR